MNGPGRVFLQLTALFASSGFLAAQPSVVKYEQGLLSVQCTNAPLGQVFDQIKAATGMELFLEDAVKNTQLTADIQSEPVPFTIERLLAGSGVNFAMSLDRQDWQRVDKIFIGEGGGGSAVASGPEQELDDRPAAAARRRALRRSGIAEPDERIEEAPEEESMVEDPVEPEEEPPEEAEFQPPPEEEPSEDYLPPPPSFPRSRFTPGLESSPFGKSQQPRPGELSPTSPEEGTNPPPAYYPFLDPFGRPIPIPPEAQQQQQQQQQQPKKPNPNPQR